MTPYINDYSILMSVYYKENPSNLKAAIDSMLDQSIPSDDFVLVCDGSLTDELNNVISEFKDRINVVRLEKNMGLGVALNEGLSHCKYEIVARMDSDDIALPDRCKLQLDILNSSPALGLVSASVNEFNSLTGEITGCRKLPESHDDILRFARKRNPMNHPCVMFKKSHVIRAGGYNEEFHLFEDYHLWIRMIQSGTRTANSPDVLLNMRTTSDFYARRGGRQYVRDMLRFHKWLRKIGFSRFIDYATGAIPHAAVCLLPSGLRTFIYRLILR